MINQKEENIRLISNLLTISNKQVTSVISLIFDDGATIPFVSRYRKEVTGGLDEVAIGNIKQEYDRLLEIAKRKETILKTIEASGSLTDELRKKIESCYDATILEDIYLPFKPKRRTRATAAKEKGLEPLAKKIYSGQDFDLNVEAKRYLNDHVTSADEALEGASDIIAEWVSEDERARAIARKSFSVSARITSKVAKTKEHEAIKYKDYFAFEEVLSRSASHRILAMIRGEREGLLKLSISSDDENITERLHQRLVKGDNRAAQFIKKSINDGYKRLIKPSIDSEFMALTKERADTAAIAIFASNLRQLLLSSPLGQKRILAIDPGFRTGCKVVCLGVNGELLHNETIYPHPPTNDSSGAMKKISQLIESYKIEAIAIGDGTAGRETEALIKRMKFNIDIQIFMVSEDGASVYSASPVAREEFPTYDVTVRGAVSIGRRLMDPLAELVKIDPKSIGVGQYQHDVDQTKLKNSLDTVVESCVNKVGVNLNTASKHLLTYVSGIGESIAKNIVEYRAANGDFTSRESLKKVPRLGAKAFEQCAGFLRIPSAKNPLDSSAVHPESYHIVKQMASEYKVSIEKLLQDKETRAKIDVNKYVTPTVGLPTLTDIMQELDKPGLDPRSEIKVFEFDDTIHTIDDLREGMVLPAIITNITAFGAFADMGVKQDGLIHISQLADRYVSDPNDIVSLHQHVEVKVLEVDKQRGRIALKLE